MHKCMYYEIVLDASLCDIYAVRKTKSNYMEVKASVKSRKHRSFDPWIFSSFYGSSLQCPEVNNGENFNDVIFVTVLRSPFIIFRIN